MTEDRHFLILVINVGSTSTKAALYRDMTPLVEETMTCGPVKTDEEADPVSQRPLREREIHRFIGRNGINLHEVDIIISRGGLLRPCPSGCYEITPAMCDELLRGRHGKHVSALGPVMALSLAREHDLRAVIIDPPSTDEFQPEARISGDPLIERQSAFHALNQKAAARRAARLMNTDYESVNLIVAHMGGGITVGAHRRGRVVDSTHGLSEGPFTPERTGSLPTLDLLSVLSSGRSVKDVQKRLVGGGGLIAYLGTNRAEEVERMIEEGNDRARLVYRAMAYQIAKDIGAMSTVLEGSVDAVVLTGGLARSRMLTGWIEERTGFIAPHIVLPGEDEMDAMAEGALRVLRGEETVIPWE